MVTINPEEVVAIEDVLEPFALELPTVMRDFWYGAEKLEATPKIWQTIVGPFSKAYKSVAEPKTSTGQLFNFIGVNGAMAAVFFFFDDILATLFPGTRKKVNKVEDRRHRNAVRRRSR